MSLIRPLTGIKPKITLPKGTVDTQMHKTRIGHN